MSLMTAGGGLTKSKLEQATAAPGDVVSGKTFYAGDKELQAGEMADQGNWNGTYSGSNVTIPAGKHGGGGSVGVAGGNRGAWGTMLNMGGSVTVPQGYHNGGGVVRARTASGQGSVFATANGDNWAQVVQVCKARAETTINVSVNGTTVRVWGELHTWIEGNGGYVGNDLRTGYDRSFSIGQA